MAANPLVPMTPAQITNAIAGYTRGLPRPLTPQQISQQAQGLIDPTIKGITDRSQAAEKAGAGAISGYANALADRMGTYGDSAKAIYGDAEAKQSATDNALASATRDQGSQLSQALAAKMDAFGAGDSAKAAFAAPQATTGAGAAGALLGTGSASLSQLIANEASARDLAAKQPDLTRQQGLADLRDLGLASNKSLADNLARVQEQLPNLVQGLRSSNDTKQTNIASVANSARQYYEGRNDSINKFNKAEADAGLNATTKANAAVTTAKIKAQTAAEAAQAKASETSFKDRLAFAKTYGYDPVTNATLPGYTRTANGTVTKAAKAGTGAKGALSDAATIKLVRQFHDGTTQSATVPQYKTVNGKPDTTQPILDRNGAPVYKTLKGAGGQMDYGQAYAMLKSVGHKTDAEARAALNTVYQRGERGRSWVTNEEQAALRSAGVQAKASVINGHGVLSAKQVAALHKAGVPLPPGSMSAEGAYVIAKGY